MVLLLCCCCSVLNYAWDGIMVGTVSQEEEDDDEGMALDELGTGKEEEEEFEDDAE